MASNSLPSHVAVHDETSPLLEAQHAEKPEPTPIPKGQLAALCTVRLVDPIAFTQLFPYVNEFMSDLHLTDDPSHIGFYSGLVESTFAIAQLCSIYQWAHLSDVIGRRPVILAGMLGLATTTVMFGLSKSLAGVLFARCVGGLFSGNVAVIHSVLGDITDATNQAVAFPIYGIIWPLGSIIGPLIGGSFSHPASKYPELFGYEFFENYPYSLPCFIVGAVAIVGVILGYAFLEESLPSKRRKNYEKASSETNVVTHLDTVSREVVEEPMSVRNLLALPIMSALAMSGFALSFVATSFDVVFVLFCYSPVQSGGLAFSASQIGYSLATAGAIGATIQVFIMSYLLRTFDCAKMYNFCMALWPYTYLSLPILNLIACKGLDEVTGTFDESTTAMLWTGIAIVLGMSKAAGLAYSLSMILTKENSPNPASLGQSNGVIQFAMCFARSFAPFVVSSLFALSIDNNLLGGYLWVVIMVFVAFLSTTISRRISRHSKRTVA
ncbi:major facilitator superfamily domain-containing protein [Phlebopus sp. FC_14]|nr:major facilitator superfamily domain-containing protein [Phlebopus sp. FC_14]